MIKNVPVAAELEEASLRLFFNAWTSLFDILEEYHEASFSSLDFEDGKLVPNEREDEENREEFIKLAQPDLQLIYTLIQHSQEIALKTMLCAVSPFLLLLGSDVRSWAKKNGDFSDFRTIDASDLMRVADAVFPGRFSAKFLAQYETVRGNRNKIQHLGAYRDKIDPLVLLDIMVNQYAEVFYGRNWFQDRVRYQSNTRWSLWHDKRWNEISVVMKELGIIFDVLKDRQYKVLFGFGRRERRYYCFDCVNEARIDDTNIRTATLAEGGNSVYCHLCQCVHAVERRDCREPDCKGNVVGVEGHNYGLCLLCGANNEALDPKDAENL